MTTQLEEIPLFMVLMFTWTAGKGRDVILSGLIMYRLPELHLTETE